MSKIKLFINQHDWKEINFPSHCYIELPKVDAHMLKYIHGEKTVETVCKAFVKI